MNAKLAKDIRRKAKQQTSRISRQVIKEVDEYIAGSSIRERVKLARRIIFSKTSGLCFK